MNNRKKVKNMTYIAVGAVIIAVCAFLTVPAALPFTMQSAGVFFVLLLFGGKRGVASIAVYIALGAIGIPVFSGFGAGFGVLFGPTGGYILGFLASGVLYWFAETKFGKHKAVKIISLVCGMIICYVLGTLVYMLWSAVSGSVVSLGSALVLCVLPYIIPDILKLAAAYVLYSRLKILISH